MKKIIIMCISLLTLALVGCNTVDTGNGSSAKPVEIPNDIPQQLKETHQGEMPSTEINARLDIDTNSYSSGDKMKLTLKNLGAAELRTGYGAYFEKMDGENWKTLYYEQAVPTIEIHVEPNDSFSEHILLRDLEKGTYRVIKQIDEQKLSVVFTVK
ncbi:immunoglobulin-like domain-containing protein [Psychrobacillus sp. NPDC096623]|uniref:immunoglobulin-like domain-containing protein n=1 Tax=Psychrobacillus sp. NPDC096623 TaxID=3364492 RepID=UPI003804D22D